MEEIKISVIIPVYNVEKYIRQCLESVINQTLKNIEIIVVNDGTKDNSMKIAEEYLSDKRIRIINKENGGQSSARNAGMREAKGKYICFIDSDDFIEKTMMEELYNKIEETNSDVVESGISLYDNKTHKIKERENKKYSYTGKGSYLWGEYTTEVCNKIYKKDFLIANNIFFEEGMIHEDDLFTIRILFSTNKICHIQKSFYYYRINRCGSTMTNVNLEKRLQALQRIVEKIKEYQKMMQTDIFSFLMLKVLEIYYLIEIYEINNENIKKEKIKELEESIKINWEKLSKEEKEILKNILKEKIVNKKAFYNINLMNKFYWKNNIISFKGFRRILTAKVLNKF